MMKLFYSPGACSLVAHIALEEAGADYELVRVMLAEGQQLTPEYLAINPHARVPAFATDRGVITENVAIINFVADMFGKDGSVPRGDPYAAARCNELLGWFASSVHIGFAGIWRATRFTSDESAHPAIQQGGRDAVERYFAEIDSLCAAGSWLVGEKFTAADSYVLTFFRWGKRIGLDVGSYRNMAALSERTLGRAAVQRAIAHEGLDVSEFSVPVTAE